MFRRNQFSNVGLLVFCLCLLFGFAITRLTNSPAPLIAGAIRDVRIPQSLENAMSQQAQAERERQARVILGDAEVQVSEKFAEASRVYNDNPGALHLRGMNMLYESMREKGSMVIVPSSAIESMGLGGTLAATAVAKQA